MRGWSATGEAPLRQAQGLVDRLTTLSKVEVPSNGRGVPRPYKRFLSPTADFKQAPDDVFHDAVRGAGACGDADADTIGDYPETQGLSPR